MNSKLHSHPSKTLSLILNISYSYSLTNNRCVLCHSIAEFESVACAMWNTYQTTHPFSDTTQQCPHYFPLSRFGRLTDAVTTVWLRAWQTLNICVKCIGYFILFSLDDIMASDLLRNPCTAQEKKSATSNYTVIYVCCIGLYD